MSKSNDAILKEIEIRQSEQKYFKTKPLAERVALENKEI